MQIDWYSKNKMGGRKLYDEANSGSLRSTKMKKKHLEREKGELEFKVQG